MTKQNDEGLIVDVDRLRRREVAANRANKAEMSEKAVKEHMSMVEAICASVCSGTRMPPSTTFQDLVSWGLEGLVKAWQNFDHNRGAQFKTYASYRIRGEVLDRLRSEWRYRNPSSYVDQQEKIQNRIAQAARDTMEQDEDGPAETDVVKKTEDLIANSAVSYLLSLDGLDPTTQVPGGKDIGQDIIDEIELSRERSVLWEEIQGLNKTEKMLVHLFYVEDYNQKEIADQLKLSKSKVSRLHVKVLDKLKRKLTRRLSD